VRNVRETNLHLKNKLINEHCTVLLGCVIHGIIMFFKSKSGCKNLGHKITSSEECFKNSSHQLQARGISYSFPFYN
jgi:hypothetical protein